MKGRHSPGAARLGEARELHGQDLERVALERQQGQVRQALDLGRQRRQQVVLRTKAPPCVTRGGRAAARGARCEGGSHA